MAPPESGACGYLAPEHSTQDAVPVSGLPGPAASTSCLWGRWHLQPSHPMERPGGEELRPNPPPPSTHPQPPRGVPSGKLSHPVPRGAGNPAHAADLGANDDAMTVSHGDLKNLFWTEIQTYGKCARTVQRIPTYPSPCAPKVDVLLSLFYLFLSVPIFLPKPFKNKLQKIPLGS